MPNWLDVYAPKPGESFNPHAVARACGAPSFSSKAAIAWEIMRRFPGVAHVAITVAADDASIPPNALVIAVDARPGFDRAMLRQYVEEELRESILDADVRAEVRLAS